MVMKHDFDERYLRTGGDSKKWSNQFFPSDVIPMWIADTDFRCPQPVIDAIIERAREGGLGYSITSKRLHTAAAHWMETRFGWRVEEDWVRFSPGVMAGITAAVRALSHAGDNLVIHTPCYTPFTLMAINNGRNLLRSPLKLENGTYTIDFEDLEDKLALPRTRVMILCNPQNPTGRVFTSQELEEIGRLCKKHNVLVISDEIHCDFVYGERRHIPFASLNPELAEITVTFINPSKTFNLAGVHTAVFISENPVLKAQVHEMLLSQKNISENIFGTTAFCTAYEQCAYYADGIVKYLETNIKEVEDALADIPGIKLVNPEGTYLLWLDCRRLGMTQEELKRFFVRKAKLGLSSGLDYGPEGNGFMRLNGACTKGTMREAMSRLNQAAAAL